MIPVIRHSQNVNSIEIENKLEVAGGLGMGDKREVGVAKRTTGGPLPVMEMLQVLTSSMSVSGLWYYSLQDVALGGNR